MAKTIDDLWNELATLTRMPSEPEAACMVRKILFLFDAQAALSVLREADPEKILSAIWKLDAELTRLIPETSRQAMRTVSPAEMMRAYLETDGVRFPRPKGGDS